MSLFKNFVTIFQPTAAYAPIVEVNVGAKAASNWTQAPVYTTAFTSPMVIVNQNNTSQAATSAGPRRISAAPQINNVTTFNGS